ncbi:unnamed protein product [Urochloa humidicola]
MANRGTAALVIAFLLAAAVTLAGADLLICLKPYGIKENETCFAVAQTTGLGLDTFLRFNPNINCNNLFVGQWVCLNAIPPLPGP